MKPDFREQVGSGWKPAGTLDEALSRFDAPSETRRLLARRVGILAGTSFLPMSDITTVIENSMRIHGGMPNWQSVTDSLAIVVNDTYRKFRRF